MNILEISMQYTVFSWLHYTGSSPFSKLENTTKTSLHDDFLWLDQPFHAAAAEL